MKKNLTDRQQDILEFIRQYRDETGFPPTLREIGAKFGISSTFGVKRHIEALSKKGYLTVESNASRGIALIEDESEGPVEVASIEEDGNMLKIPVVGRVAAGVPITALENVEGNIVIDPAFVQKSEQCFALRVQGDSMIEAGIFEEDYVIVSPDRRVSNHDIVVARIEDEATVKRFYKNNGQVMLIPENKYYAPIDVTNDPSFAIAGKVVGVIRWFH